MHPVLAMLGLLHVLATRMGTRRLLSKEALLLRFVLLQDL